MALKALFILIVDMFQTCISCCVSQAEPYRTVILKWLLCFYTITLPILAMIVWTYLDHLHVIKSTAHSTSSLGHVHQSQPPPRGTTYNTDHSQHSGHLHQWCLLHLYTLLGILHTGTLDHIFLSSLSSVSSFVSWWVVQLCLCLLVHSPLNVPAAHPSVVVSSVFDIAVVATLVVAYSFGTTN